MGRVLKMRMEKSESFPTIGRAAANFIAVDVIRPASEFLLVETFGPEVSRRGDRLRGDAGFRHTRGIRGFAEGRSRGGAFPEARG